MKFSGLGMALLLAVALLGCGGGSADNLPPRIVIGDIIPFTSGSSTGGGKIDSRGGSALGQLRLSDASNIDPKSVLMDVLDASGKSIVGGPSRMGEGHSTISTGGFSQMVQIPANTTTKAQVYNFLITASDIKGNKINPPVSIGTVTVPAP